MSDEPLPETLDAYALKSMDYGQLTGLALACHAIPDAFLLMHVGVGCKNKATAHLMIHDWAEHGNIREAWTEVSDGDLILSASERAAPYLRSWYKRMEPAVMVITSVTFIDLAGEDLIDHVERASKDLPCPIWYVKTPGYDPDLYLGYAKLVLEVARQLPWADTPAKPGVVSVIGYLFDRYEGDHEGNLSQIKGLIKLAGLTPGPCLLSGEPMATLEQAASSEILVQWPYLRPVARKLRKLARQRTLVDTDLPMGLGGTRRWVRQIAEAAGTASPALDRRLDAREDYVRRQIAHLLDRWREQQVMVVAEPPLAAGLCAVLLDLGLTPAWIGLRGATLGGAEAFHAALDQSGYTLPADLEVVDNPSLHTIREAMTEALAAGTLRGVFGAATEMNLLTTLPRALFEREQVTGEVQSQGPFMVEIGFPCRDFHAITPMPWLGYGGVVVLAQRILTAPRLWDSGRALSFQL